jgi:four helix bundle protein
MGVVEIEELDLFRGVEAWADEIWAEMVRKEPFVRRTLGAQLVDAADSVGSNLAEGDGRATPKDRLRFLTVARGSLKETRVWIARAARRGIVDREIARRWYATATESLKKLNALISYRRDAAGIAREEVEDYRTEGDPFAPNF